MKIETKKWSWDAWALLLNLSLLSACKKPVAEAPPPPPPEPVAAITPAPAPPPPVTAAATPAPDYLAPPGVFFLTQKASIETPDGIVGLKAGHLVRLVGVDTYEAEGYQLQLRSDQVSNDLRVAQQLAGADAVAQAALRQTLQAGAAAASARQAAQDRAAASSSPSTAAHPTPRPKAAPAAPSRSLQGPSLDGSQSLGTQQGTSRDRIYIDSSGRRFWRDSSGKTRYD
ncbi:MAG: hypothetical protein QOE70_4146 [Chthoniobacter sp.]|jgi:hypothetical protein|nr:hypothetical protein [Chthoniobacter sp.]